MSVVILSGGMAGLQAEPNFPAYQKVSGVEGTLVSMGSEPLNHLMVSWSDAFRDLYPNVKVQIEGLGSGTAAPRSPQGLPVLGPISRRLLPEEEQAFEQRRGFRPMCLKVAVDCVALYVHKDNPLPGLTLAQIDCIFSKTLRRGYRNIVTWDALGLAGPWAETPISLYGPDSISGASALIKQRVLLGGDYKETVEGQAGATAVLRCVSRDPAGIGYASTRFGMSNVRALPLSRTENDPFIEPSFENALAGTYPLGRALYIYLPKRPEQRLPKVNEEFAKFIFSREGQEVVARAGYGALPPEVIAGQIELLK